jgi:hypothetical protein
MKRVKHTKRNFTGTCNMSVIQDRYIIIPEDREIRKLYPFGIETSINNIEVLSDVEVNKK